MTAQEYTASLRRIEQDNPSEVLLPLLRAGHSRANEIYLRAALRRCHLQSVRPPQSPRRGEATRSHGIPTNKTQENSTIKLTPTNKTQKNSTIKTTPTNKTQENHALPPSGGAGGGTHYAGGTHADETLRTLWRERTRLFGEMNKQSNLFHACKTDAERAANSARVLSWWDDILAVKSKIAWYEQHGELPPVAEEGDELPDNAALLAKKLNSLRARISQVKKKLVDMAGLDPGTPGLQSKINAAEDDLKQLQYQAGKAAVKLKEYESAA